MPMKYAAFTVMTPEFTIPEAAELLAQLGYNGVEWRVHNVPDVLPAKSDFWRGNKATVDFDTIVSKAREVRKLTGDHGLEVVGLGTYLNYRMLNDIERCMEAASIMGAGSIRVNPGTYDGTENYHDLYEEAVDGYAKVEDLAREFKICACIETHRGGMCPSASLAYRLVSNFDPDYVGVILDPGNMVCEGYENWQLGLELLGPYLSYVHVKNAAWSCQVSGGGENEWNAGVVSMKEGCVSWREVLMALDKVGYKGWLSLEDLAKADTEAKLAEDIAYLKSIEAELGI